MQNLRGPTGLVVILVLVPVIVLLLLVVVELVVVELVVVVVVAVVAVSSIFTSNTEEIGHVATPRPTAQAKALPSGQ